MAPKKFKSAERVVDSDDSDAAARAPSATKKVAGPPVTNGVKRTAAPTQEQSAKKRHKSVTPAEDSSEEESSSGSEEEDESSGEDSKRRSSGEESEEEDDESSSSEEEDNNDTSIATTPTSNAQPSTTDPPLPAQAQAKSSYEPPPGFQPASSIHNENIEIFKLLDASNLAGKELWHIAIPQSIPASAIKEIDLSKARENEAIISHNGTEYTLASDATAKTTLLLPTENGVSYGHAPSNITKNFHIQQIVRPSQNLAPNSPYQAGSAAAAVTNIPPVRQPRAQPEGLRTRHWAAGFEDPGVFKPHLSKDVISETEVSDDEESTSSGDESRTGTAASKKQPGSQSEEDDSESSDDETTVRESPPGKAVQVNGKPTPEKETSSSESDSSEEESEDDEAAAKKSNASKSIESDIESKDEVTTDESDDDSSDTPTPAQSKPTTSNELPTKPAVNGVAKEDEDTSEESQEDSSSSSDDSEEDEDNKPSNNLVDSDAEESSSEDEEDDDESHNKSDKDSDDASTSSSSSSEVVTSRSITPTPFKHADDSAKKAEVNGSHVPSSTSKSASQTPTEPHSKFKQAAAKLKEKENGKPPKTPHVASGSADSDDNDSSEGSPSPLRGTPPKSLSPTKPKKGAKDVGSEKEIKKGRSETSSGKKEGAKARDGQAQGSARKKSKD